MVIEILACARSIKAFTPKSLEIKGSPLTTDGSLTNATGSTKEARLSMGLST